MKTIVHTICLQFLKKIIFYFKAQKKVSFLKISACAFLEKGMSRYRVAMTHPKEGLWIENQHRAQWCLVALSAIWHAFRLNTHGDSRERDFKPCAHLSIYSVAPALRWIWTVPVQNNYSYVNGNLGLLLLPFKLLFFGEFTVDKIDLLTQWTSGDDVISFVHSQEHHKTKVR